MKKVAALVAILALGVITFTGCSLYKYIPVIDHNAPYATVK